jgi:hypothetical protein
VQPGQKAVLYTTINSWPRYEQWHLNFLDAATPRARRAGRLLSV